MVGGSDDGVRNVDCINEFGIATVGIVVVLLMMVGRLVATGPLVFPLVDDINVLIDWLRVLLLLRFAPLVVVVVSELIGLPD